jgi:hypothetical protein
MHRKLSRRFAAVALPTVLVLTLAGTGVAQADERGSSQEGKRNETGATMLNIPLGICITLVEACSTRSEASSGDASVDHDGHDRNIRPSERSDSGGHHDNSEAADRDGETGPTFLNIPIGLCLSLVDGCGTESQAGSGDAGMEPMHAHDASTN